MASSNAKKEVIETAPETEYTVAELVCGARQTFKESPDVVSAALRVACVKTATVKKAKEIIENFKKKEVR